MKVSKVEIRNILGIEDLEILPGSLTVVSGANATGKTSCLNAIRSLLSGGHEPDMIRQGADEGSVALTLEDGITITKVIKPDKSTLTVRHPKLGKISKSQQWINNIVDSLSLDPIAFLSAPAKDRVKILLEALPLKLTAEQFRFLPATAITGKNMEGHALEVLGQIGRELYDERTGVNRAAKEKLSTVAQMEESLPPAPPAGDWQTVYRERLGEFQELQKSTAARVNQVKREAAQHEQDQQELLRAMREKLNGKMHEEIERVRQEFANRSTLAATESAQRIGAIHHDRDTTLAHLEGEYRPRNSELQQLVSEAQAQLNMVEKAKSARELISRFEAEAAELQAESEALTEQLGKLDALKVDLLQSLPIPGLEIRDGAVYLEGIPFDRVNTAAQYRMAIEIAKLRAGDLGLVLLDRAEIFDPANWQAFQEAAAAAKVQVIAARVSEGPLEVRSEAARA